MGKATSKPASPAIPDKSIHTGATSATNSPKVGTLPKNFYATLTPRSEKENVPSPKMSGKGGTLGRTADPSPVRKKKRESITRKSLSALLPLTFTQSNSQHNSNTPHNIHKSLQDPSPPPSPSQDPDGDIFSDLKNSSLLFAKKRDNVTREDFELLSLIGKGSFAKVLQVRKLDTGRIYAMKILRKDAIILRKQVDHTRSEKAILQKIKHPFIVSLQYAFQTETKLYLILDFINGGELYHHLKKCTRFPESRARFYAAEISTALRHLHSFDILYRDLKPENVLLDAGGHICLTDFGLSKEISPAGSPATTFCGTPEYLAPELLKGGSYGPPVDWWSLGILVYEMLTGLPPFYAQNLNSTYQGILFGQIKYPAFMSEDAKELIAGLLEKDPEKRIGGQSICEQRFFSEIDWEKLARKECVPPFLPEVISPEDLREIDRTFTSEKPTDSVVERSAIADLGASSLFTDFTYTSPSVIQVQHHETPEIPLVESRLDNPLS